MRLQGNLWRRLLYVAAALGWDKEDLEQEYELAKLKNDESVEFFIYRDVLSKVRLKTSTYNAKTGEWKKRGKILDSVSLEDFETANENDAFFGVPDKKAVDGVKIAERRDALRRAKEIILKDRIGEAFWEVFVDGVSMRETGEKHGISESWVSYETKRLRENLRRNKELKMLLKE